ncbi:MAG: serine hydrolase [Ignavibacteria bacterium]
MESKKCLLLIIILTFLGCSTDNTDSITNIQPFETGSLDTFLDSEKIADLLLEINNGTFGEVNSLLIMRNDTLCLEKYFNGFSVGELHRCYSVTKSFTSALIGIAIDKGFINSVNQKLLDFFPRYLSLENYSSLKERITIDHVLKMSAGFEWDEWTYNYNDSRNDVLKLANSQDWIKYMLDLPMQDTPGTKFLYNTGCTILLSGIIYQTTGMRTSAFAEQYLFEPLGITNYQWEEGPNNITNTGWGLRLTSRDILKLGKLFLNKGVWEGQQVISEDWRNNSTQTKISITEKNKYAYQWWTFGETNSYVQQLETNDIFYADGWGDQYIFVIPHLKLVVATHAENYTNGMSSAPMLRDYIIPAAISVD